MESTKMSDTTVPYPDADAQEELAENFPNKFEWFGSNASDVTERYPYSTTCKSLVSTFYGRTGHAIDINNTSHAYAVGESALTTQIIQNESTLSTLEPDFVDYIVGVVPYEQGASAHRWMRNNCRVPVEALGDSTSPSELMDYEYEKAKMAHIFEAEGGVGDVLTQNLAPITGEFAECAQIYKDKAVELKIGIEDFWKKEAVDNIFVEGYDIDTMTSRHTIINPGSVPNPPISRADWFGLDTGIVISSIYGDELPDEYGLSTMSWEEAENGVVSPTVMPANFSGLGLMLPIGLQAGLGETLKYPERVYVDDGGNFTDQYGEPVSGNLKNFPFYWAGLIINFIRIADFIASRAPNDQEMASLQSGDTENAWMSISMKNHGPNTKQDLYDIPYRSSPHAVFNKAATYLLPRNSVATKNLQTMASQRLFNGVFAPEVSRLTVSGIYASANAALQKLSTYFPALTDVQAIQTKISELYNIMLEIKQASDCILEKAEEADLQFDLAEASMGEMASEGLFGYFKNRSLNAAIDAAKANLEDVTPAAFIARSEERVLFREQCFLLSFVSTIAEHKKNYLDYVSNGVPRAGSTHKKMSYTVSGFPLSSGVTTETPGQYNASLQVNGDAYGFINRLTQSPKHAAFFDIDNWMLSNMQPKIRLFKVQYDEQGNETEVEMRFNSSFSKDEMDLFKSTKARGVGVGLKSFTFTYDGSNPFSAKKSIKANLKIFANSFNELFEDRPGETTTIDQDQGTPAPGQPALYKYVDLAIKTFSKTINKDMKPTEWQKIVNENVNKSKLNFRLKAVVGWSEPKHANVAEPSGIYTNREVKDAVKESYVTLNLTPTVHNFDFDEQGRVIFEINYLAYVEDFFDDRAYNVFADPSGRNGMNRTKRELKTKKYTKECSESNTKELNELKREYAQIASTEKTIAVQSIINTLVELNRIHYINLPLENIREFTSMGPFAAYDGYVLEDEYSIGTSYVPEILTGTEQAEYAAERVEQALEEAAAVDDEDQVSSEEAMNKLRSSLVALEPGQHYLTFFYLSDLVDVVLANIEKELTYLKENITSEVRKEDMFMKFEESDLSEKIADLNKYLNNFKRLRILLGPVELAEPVAEETPYRTTFVNFGDLPISVRYFAEFLASTALKNDETVYSLPRFLNDLFNNLVNNFLNSKTCFNFDISQKVRVNQSVLTSYAYQQRGGKSKDEITTLLETKAARLKRQRKSGVPSRLFLNDPEITSLPLINISGVAGEESNYAPLSHEINYFVFFAARTRPADRMVGDMAQDLQGGIFHYILGRDKGIVKNIKLQKTQTPGLQEVRFEQEGYDGLEQLRVVYDVEIDCYANVNAFPGTYIYIPPQGFDPGADMDLTKFGIGGYYMIYRSSHNFAAGEANSKIYAKWVAQIETEANRAEQANASALTEITKCTLPRKENSQAQ